MYLATSLPPPGSLTPIQLTTSPLTDGSKNSFLTLSFPNLGLELKYNHHEKNKPPTKYYLGDVVTFQRRGTKLDTFLSYKMFTVRGQ